MSAYQALRDHGVHSDKRLGQHILVDPAAMVINVTTASANHGSAVVEGIQVSVPPISPFSPSIRSGRVQSKICTVWARSDSPTTAGGVGLIQCVRWSCQL